MTLSGVRASDMRAMLARLLAVLALFTICALPADAQGSASPDRKAGVKRLFKAAGVREASAEVFKELVSRYQKRWPDSVLADYRKKGLFKPLTPDETAQMEKLIVEFSDRVFGDMKKRVVGEVLTEENLENLVEPVFEKYLDAGEVSRLADFAETPLGRKILEVTAKKLRMAVIDSMEAAGAFNIAPSPEEESARLDRLMKGGNGSRLIEDVQRDLAAHAATFTSDFTPEEMRELMAFVQSPLGLKLAKVYAPMSVELFQRNAQLYAPRAGQIAVEVFAEQMEFFKERTNEILKDAGPRMKAARQRGN
jgi:hypothetical protein